ncbi:unnamed protein product [Closterium sp. NIES-65]|nr:unnamed protein product [Closterium sp. NIES-65]
MFVSVLLGWQISVIDITIFIARRCSSTSSNATSASTAATASASCGRSIALESIQEQQSGEETEGEGEGEGKGAGEGEGAGEGRKGSEGRGGGERGKTEQGGGGRGNGGGMSEKRGGISGVGRLEWLKEARVADVMGKTEETRTMLVLDPHATVLQAMELLGSRGFHRALVPNMCPCDHDQTTSMPMPALLQSRLGGGEGGTAGEEYRVLSQMDIAAFMLKHEGLLGLALAKSIDDIGLVWPSVVSVTPSTPLLDAFNMFRIRGISAVAVVQPKPAPPAVVVEEGGGDSKDEEGGTEKTKEASVVLPQWPMGGCGSVLTGTLSASDVKQVDVGASHKGGLTTALLTAQPIHTPLHFPSSLSPFVQRLFSASCAFPASQPPSMGGQTPSVLPHTLSRSGSPAPLSLFPSPFSPLPFPLSLFPSPFSPLHTPTQCLFSAPCALPASLPPCASSVVTITDVLRTMRVLPILHPWSEDSDPVLIKRGGGKGESGNSSSGTTRGRAGDSSNSRGNRNSSSGDVGLPGADSRFGRSASCKVTGARRWNPNISLSIDVNTWLGTSSGGRARGGTAAAAGGGSGGSDGGAGGGGGGGGGSVGGGGEGEVVGAEGEGGEEEEGDDWSVTSMTSDDDADVAGPATVTGTSGSSFDSYYWLDWWAEKPALA